MARRLPSRIVDLVNRPWDKAVVHLQDIINSILDWLNDSWGGVHATDSSDTNGVMIITDSGTVGPAEGVDVSACGPGALTLAQGTTSQYCPYINHTVEYQPTASGSNNPGDWWTSDVAYFRGLSSDITVKKGTGTNFTNVDGIFVNFEFQDENQGSYGTGVYVNAQSSSVGTPGTGQFLYGGSFNADIGGQAGSSNATAIGVSGFVNATTDATDVCIGVEGFSRFINSHGVGVVATHTSPATLYSQLRAESGSVPYALIAHGGTYSIAACNNSTNMRFLVDGAGAVNLFRNIEHNTAGVGAPNLLFDVSTTTTDKTESFKILTNQGSTAKNYHTLPTAATSANIRAPQFSFVVLDADGMRITANTGDTIRIGSKVSASAGFIESTVIGSTITLVALNATEWIATDVTGHWTVDGTEPAIIFPVFDNGSTTDYIALFRNNGVNQVLVGDGVPADNSQHFLEVVGTLPSSPSATVEGVVFNITSAGSSSNFQNAVDVYLNAGYTGSGNATAMYVENDAAGTGTNLIGNLGNFGISTFVGTTTTGNNVGFFGWAQGGNRSVGVVGRAIDAKNSATNIGVAGFGRNSGTSPVEIGGYFGLNTSDPTFTSAALVADNAAVAAPIFRGRDNGTDVWTIQDGGHVYAKMGSKTLTEGAATGFVRISVPQGTTVGGILKYSIEANDGTDFQARTGIIPFNAYNKAGTEVGSFSTPDAGNETFVESAGASTLTNTFTIPSNAADTLDFSANATSSLAQTTLRINYTIEMFSNAVVTVTPL